MTFFSKNLPNSELHDLISGEATPRTAAEIRARRSSDANFDAEALEFERIRRSLQSLPNLPAPRSFRLNPQMAGVKPPKPRSFAWATYAAALMFVLSIGFRTIPLPLSASEKSLAMEAAPMLLEAPMEAPMAAPAAEMPSDIPEAAAFAEIPAAEQASDDLALQAAPMDAPAEGRSRKMPDDPSDDMNEAGSVGSPTSALSSFSMVAMWVSLGLALLLLALVLLGRLIQIRTWRKKMGARRHG